AIPLLQVVRCQSIHVFAGNKHYRVTYLVRRECCNRVPRAKATREFVARPRTEQMNSPAAIGFGRSPQWHHRSKARVCEEFVASRERPASAHHMNVSSNPFAVSTTCLQKMPRQWAPAGASSLSE